MSERPDCTPSDSDINGRWKPLPTLPLPPSRSIIGIPASLISVRYRYRSIPVQKWVPLFHDQPGSGVGIIFHSDIKWTGNCKVNTATQLWCVLYTLCSSEGGKLSKCLRSSFGCNAAQQGEEYSSVGCSIAQHKAVGTTYLKRVHPSSVKCIVAPYIGTA